MVRCVGEGRGTDGGVAKGRRRLWNGQGLKAKIFETFLLWLSECFGKAFGGFRWRTRKIGGFGLMVEAIGGLCLGL